MTASTASIGKGTFDEAAAWHLRVVARNEPSKREAKQRAPIMSSLRMGNRDIRDSNRLKKENPTWKSSAHLRLYTLAAAPMITFGGFCALLLGVRQAAGGRWYSTRTILIQLCTLTAGALYFLGLYELSDSS